MKKNKDYKNFYEVLSMKKGDILIVDPYAINIPDLTNLDLPINFNIPIIRIRRPFWGRGNLSEYINKVSPEDLKKVIKDMEVHNDLSTT